MAVVVRRQGWHVKRVAEVRASSLTHNEFLQPPAGRAAFLACAQKPCFSGISARRLIFLAQKLSF
jgi:hypothetical protein